MPWSVANLETMNPLKHNIELVLPGVHSQLSNLQGEMAAGFQMVQTWMDKIERKEMAVDAMMAQIQAMAQ
jgi:hypothetical protein